MPGKGPEETKMVAWRLPKRVLRALDEAYWTLRRPRTQIVSDALEDYLPRRGIKVDKLKVKKKR